MRANAVQVQRLKRWKNYQYAALLTFPCVMISGTAPLFIFFVAAVRLQRRRSEYAAVFADQLPNLRDFTCIQAIRNSSSVICDKGDVMALALQADISQNAWLSACHDKAQKLVCNSMEFTESNVQYALLILLAILLPMSLLPACKQYSRAQVLPVSVGDSEGVTTDAAVRQVGFLRKRIQVFSYIAIEGLLAAGCACVIWLVNLLDAWSIHSAWHNLWQRNCAQQLEQALATELCGRADLSTMAFNASYWSGQCESSWQQSCAEQPPIHIVVVAFVVGLAFLPATLLLLSGYRNCMRKRRQKRYESGRPESRSRPRRPRAPTPDWIKVSREKRKKQKKRKKLFRMK